MNLRRFWIQNNELISLPNSFGDLSSLDLLMAQNNLLSSLPESICNIATNQNISLNLFNNNICDEYIYDCLSDDFSCSDNDTNDGSCIYPQDTSNCP